MLWMLLEDFQENIFGRSILIYNCYSEQSVFNLTKTRALQPDFLERCLKMDNSISHNKNFFRYIKSLKIATLETIALYRISLTMRSLEIRTWSPSIQRSRVQAFGCPVSKHPGVQSPSVQVSRRPGVQSPSIQSSRVQTLRVRTSRLWSPLVQSPVFPVCREFQRLW